MDREAKLKLIWKNLHRDFKGTIDGVKMIMLPAKFGGGLAPLASLNDEQIEYMAYLWKGK